MPMVRDREIKDAVERLALRKRAYMAIPLDAMLDLAGFCRAERSCWDADPRVHAALEGRREVYLRIKQHHELSAEELLVLYSDGAIALWEIEGAKNA